MPAAPQGFRHLGFSLALAVALYGAWVFVKRNFEGGRPMKRGLAAPLAACSETGNGQAIGTPDS